MAYTVEPEILTRFGTDVLTSLGVPAADAHLLSDSLVTAELWGHSSHGMLRLPWYVERLRSGVMTAVTTARWSSTPAPWSSSTAITASGRC